ncbi:MAG: hypothetical protein ABR521_01070 [Gaiellaceae bacterium]
MIFRRPKAVGLEGGGSNSNSRWKAGRTQPSGPLGVAMAGRDVYDPYED